MVQRQNCPRSPSLSVTDSSSAAEPGALPRLRPQSSPPPPTHSPGQFLVRWPQAEIPGEGLLSAAAPNLPARDECPAL